jgi:hypothetical protein
LGNRREFVNFWQGELGQPSAYAPGPFPVVSQRPNPKMRLATLASTPASRRCSRSGLARPKINGLRCAPRQLRACRTMTETAIIAPFISTVSARSRGGRMRTTRLNEHRPLAEIFRAGSADHLAPPSQSHCHRLDRDMEADGLQSAYDRYQSERLTRKSGRSRSPSQPRTAARKAGVLEPRKQLREREGLSAGGSRIRTLGPPLRDSIFSRPPRNLATTNRPGSQNRILTIDKGRYTVRRARLAPAMISTPDHRASRRRQCGALPAWSRDALSAPSSKLRMLRLAACAPQR